MPLVRYLNRVSGMDLKPNQLVAFIFLIGTFLIILYEVWAIGWRDQSWTVTAVLREWSEDAPMLPIIVGILIGHLFFCKCPKIHVSGPSSIPPKGEIKIVQEVICDKTCR